MGVLQLRGHIRVGHPPTFVHPHRQRQGLRPQLHPGRSQSVRGLSGIAPLPSFLTLLTVADVDIEASPHGLADYFQLVLRRGPIEGHAPPTATSPGQGYGNDFVHLRGREFGVSPAISATRLAPRGFRMLFSRAPREGSRLSFGGPLGFFPLASQPVIFISWSFPFPFQPLPLLLPLFSFSLQLALLTPQLCNLLTQLFNRSPGSTPSLLKLCDLAFQLA